MKLKYQKISISHKRKKEEYTKQNMKEIINKSECSIKERENNIYRMKRNERMQKKKHKGREDKREQKERGCRRDKRKKKKKKKKRKKQMKWDK